MSDEKVKITGQWLLEILRDLSIEDLQLPVMISTLGSDAWAYEVEILRSKRAGHLNLKPRILIKGEHDND